MLAGSLEQPDEGERSVGAALVDIDAGMPSQESSDRRLQPGQAGRRGFRRVRKLGERAYRSGAADRQLPVVLSVDVEQQAA
jgi:hypothetical protein